jgi:hypothetical protein
MGCDQQRSLFVIAFARKLAYRPSLPFIAMKPRKLLTLVLASLPFLAICLSVPLWDRVYPLVFGLPFNMFWLVLWMPLSSLCMWGVYRLRKTAAPDEVSER